MTNDLSTLICLFHHQDQAQAALEEILQAGIPEANVTLVGAPGTTIAASKSTLTELNVPEKDVQHLLDGIEGGGAVLAVSAISDHAEKVEAIFEQHKAGKIDEATIADDMSAQALPFGSRDDFAADDDSALLSEAEQDAEDIVIVTGTVDELGIAHVESIETVEVVPVRTGDSSVAEDVDPRELGLDARMNPVPRKTQVD